MGERADIERIGTCGDMQFRRCVGIVNWEVEGALLDSKLRGLKLVIAHNAW